jgi:hypothetical protein
MIKYDIRMASSRRRLYDNFNANRSHGNGKKSKKCYCMSVVFRLSCNLHIIKSIHYVTDCTHNQDCLSCNLHIIKSIHYVTDCAHNQDCLSCNLHIIKSIHYVTDCSHNQDCFLIMSSDSPRHMKRKADVFNPIIRHIAASDGSERSLEHSLHGSRETLCSVCRNGPRQIEMLL